MARMSAIGDWNALSEQEQRYQQREMEIYAAMAEAMDHEVGRLIAHLESTGEYDNSVFVFLSDNGSEASDYKEAQLWLETQYTQDMDKLGGKGAYGIAGPGWVSASVSHLRGYKCSSTEGGIRTPMFIAGVAGAPDKQITHALTHVTDIARTLLDLALFRGDLKLARNSPPAGDGERHLYDIRNDPGETRDLQAGMPEVFASMQQDYRGYEESHRVLPMPEGYSPARTVLINVIYNYWLPACGPRFAAGMLLLSCTGVFWNRRRAAKK